MADQKLTDYVRKNIQSMGADKIRKTLIGKGWDAKSVNEAISMFSSPNAPAPVSKPQAKQGDGSHIKIIGIVAAIAAVILVVYIFVFSGMDLSQMIPGEGGSTEPGGQEPVTSPITISSSPEGSGYGVGDMVVVDISASGAVSLFGFQFDLSYDPSVLSLQSVSEGSFLNSNGADSTFCVNADTSSTGSVKNYACTRLNSGGTATGVEGSGVLARVTFTALASGSSQLTLSNVKLADTQASQIPSELNSGQVIISG
jgi:hypothetical protein